MDFANIATLSHRKKADLLAIPFWQGKKHPEIAAVEAANLEPLFAPAVASGDFKGKKGEVLVLYTEGEPEPRLALVGLGSAKEASVETVRRSYAALARACQARRVETLNVLLPTVTKLKKKGGLRGVVEGLLLANYAFEKLKKSLKKEKKTVLLKKSTLIGADRGDLSLAKRFALTADGVYFARDLVNGNADDVTPQFLAQQARHLAKTFTQVKTTVFDRRRLEKEKMGLLLAVNRGSCREPAFIITEYRGNPRSKDSTVLVGKGISYDTGGLDLKTGPGMMDMRGDMGGAAAVLGTILAAASLGLKVNVTGVIPTTENSIDAESYKQGDVYTGYAGKSVEIRSTDAEGRLVLADALAYACENLNPTRLIDFATLTGSIVVALGDAAMGIMGNDDKLIKSLEKAGKETFERVWQMPLFDEYKEALKSDVADLRNVGTRAGSACVAGQFLHEFITKKVPWVHCDIAGGAFLDKAKDYNPKNGTGLGVRLMIELLEGLSA